MITTIKGVKDILNNILEIHKKRIAEMTEWTEWSTQYETSMKKDIEYELTNIIKKHEKYASFTEENILVKIPKKVLEDIDIYLFSCGVDS